MPNWDRDDSPDDDRGTCKHGNINGWCASCDVEDRARWNQRAAQLLRERANPEPKLFGVEIMGVNDEPSWFTNARDFLAHVDMLLSMPVDGGTEIRVTEYTLTRSVIRKGTKV